MKSICTKSLVILSLFVLSACGDDQDTTPQDGITINDSQGVDPNLIREALEDMEP